MRRRHLQMYLLLTALLLLPGCGGEETADRTEPTAPEETPPAVQTPAEEVPPGESPDWNDELLGFPEDTWQLWEPETRTSCEDWTYPDQPHLLEGDRYQEMFRMKYVTCVYDPGTDTYRRYCTVPAYSPPAPEWYGVPDCFPFVGEDAVGMTEGGGWCMDGCEEALAIAARNYSAVCGYSAPDGTRYVMQTSNYPQFSYEMFSSDMLAQYRWFWNRWEMENEDFPQRPEPYGEPIQLRVAEMNWNAEGWFPDSEWYDYERYGKLSFSEQVALQNEWMERYAVDSERYVPEAERYCAVTGLTVLNGDSRTEADWRAGGRAKDIRITVNGEAVKELTLWDSPAPQLIDLDYTQHTLTKPLDIRIEVLSAYPGTGEGVYITEIGVGITSNLDQGI